MRRPNPELEYNQLKITLSSFVEAYNRGIPSDFPHATVSILKQFQAAHPVLFRSSDEWSLERHRKRLMDWLAAHPNVS